MSLRRGDQERRYLREAIGWLPNGRAPRESIITHKYWIRMIYGVACFGFMFAFYCALRRFE